MSELRQKFEELPDIKGIIYGSDFGFNESLNQYYHPDHTNHRLNYAFIMGAWCAFQSRQAEIDQLKTQLNNMEACYIGVKKEFGEKSVESTNWLIKASEEQVEKEDLQERIDGVSQVLCELKESMEGFKEMDLYDKGCRVTTEYVIADLEQALRGGHE